MRSEKDWKKWFNSLSDGNIADILDKKNLLDKTSKNTDNKIKTMILNADSLPQEKKVIDFQFTKKTALSYSLSFAAAAAVIITAFILIKNFLIPSVTGIEQNICFAEKTENIVYATDRHNKTVQLKNNDIIKENTIIKTDSKSAVTLKISGRHYINLFEETAVNTVKLYKDRKKEIIDIYVKKGKAGFNAAGLNKQSAFKTQTDKINIEVTGTKYSVEVINNKTIITVEDGSILIQPKINIVKLIRLIKKIDKMLANKTESTLLEKYAVGKNKIIIIDDEKFLEIEKSLKAFSDKISEYGETNRKSAEELNKTKNYIEEETKRIKLMLLGLSQEQTQDKTNEKSEIKFNSIKISDIKINLPVLNTSVTSDGISMYIACDINQTVYSVDLKTGRLNWIFKDPMLTDITSPAFPYKDMIVISAPENIFVLTKTGRLKNRFNTAKGVSYWAVPVIISGNLYIPTSSGIQIFNGEQLKPLDNLNEIDGQLYAAYKGNLLYICNSNEQKIKIFDLVQSRKIFESDKISSRSFCAPSEYNGYVYITDISSSIHRFDPKDKNNTRSLNINAGVLSNVIFYNNTAYFTANNGYFYSIGLRSFDRFNKIQKIDNSPGKDLYLTKKSVLFNDKIFFNSDSGQLFCHDIKSGRHTFIKVSAFPLTGTPVISDNAVFVADEKSGIYKITEQ